MQAIGLDIYKCFLLFTGCVIVLGNERNARSLPFTDGSAMGLFVGLLTPLESSNGNVFFSYTLESAFYLPTAVNVASLAAVQKYDIKGRSESAEGRLINETNSTPFTTVRPKAKRGLASFLNRRIFYDFLESKMQAFGLNGRQCLLKTICQAADIELGRNNGVLGDLFHVIFTPSTSSDRVFSLYTNAEKVGLQRDGVSCSQYNAGCPKSLLDIISVSNF